MKILSLIFQLSGYALAQSEDTNALRSKFETEIIQPIVTAPSINLPLTRAQSIPGGYEWSYHAEKDEFGITLIRIQYYSSETLTKEMLERAGNIAISRIRPVENLIGDAAVIMNRAKKGGWIKFRLKNCLITVNSSLMVFDEVERLAKFIEEKMKNAPPPPDSLLIESDEELKKRDDELKRAIEVAAQNALDPDPKTISKQEVAKRVRRDLESIHDALAWFEEQNQLKKGDTITWEQIKDQFKRHPRLHSGLDLMGHPFAKEYRAGEIPKVAAETAAALKDEVPEKFWNPYK